MYIYSLIAYIQTLSKQHISGTSHPEESVIGAKCDARVHEEPRWSELRKKKTFTSAEQDKSNTEALE